MTRIISTLAFLAVFAASGVFAQQPQVIVNDETGIVSITERNDPSGIAARNAFFAAQMILIEDRPEVFFVPQLTPEEDRQDRWQRARDTLQSLQPYITDAFVNAHYLLGMAHIYTSMMHSGMFSSDEERVEITENVARTYNAFIQNGVAANSTFVLSSLANIYWWNLNNPRRALELIDQCIAIAPNDPNYHLMRGMLLHGGGYVGAACASIRRALELSAGDQETRELVTEMIERWGCP